MAKRDKLKKNKDSRPGSNSFQPELDFAEVEFLLRRAHFDTTNIQNTKLYQTVEELTDLALPSHQDKHKKKWCDFYLPTLRKSKLATIPFTIVEYKKEFFAIFHQWSVVAVKTGNQEIEEMHKKIFEQSLGFARFLKTKDIEFLKKVIPYDFRTGKIKSKYVLKRLISKKEKRTIRQKYQKQLKKEDHSKPFPVSLNDYLRVAALCYRAVYPKEAKGLSCSEMYSKWADGRDGGMLSIKNPDSKEEFTEWRKSGAYAGAHPFEIVFSWRRHGIHLYPPSSYNNWSYGLRVTNYTYADDFLKMVKALLRQKIPFYSRCLEHVLDYLSGEVDFTVNEYGEHDLSYIPSPEYRKHYFKHIKWDQPKMPQWK